MAVYGNPAPSGTQSTTSVTTASTTVTASWSAGDWLIGVASIANGNATVSAPTGTGLTFASLGSPGTINASGTNVQMWSANPGSAGSSVVVTFTESTAVQWDVTIYRFSGATGAGTPVTKMNSTTSTDTNGTATVNTTVDNSAIVYVAADWVAVNQTAPTFSTATAGTFTLEHNIFVTSQYSSFGGVYQNAGAVGAKTVGLTSGTGMRISYYTVEVKGVARPRPPRVTQRAAMIRSSNF